MASPDAKNGDLPEKQAKPLLRIVFYTRKEEKSPNGYFLQGQCTLTLEIIY